MNVNSPEFLYHYTNIESLALILKNRNFRFSPLTALDDTEEQQNYGNLPVGKYVFVSSWTSLTTESIPMWHMYTGLTQGVRIRMRKFPFKSYIITKEELQHFGLEINGGAIKCFVPIDKMFNEDYTVLHWDYSKILHPITYEPIKTKKQIIVDDKYFMMALGELGKNKNEYWSFQEEWRYILCFHAIPLATLLQDTSIGIKHLLQFNDLPFSDFFLDIDDDSFNEMEITLSPKISDGSKEIVKLLVKEFAPYATIKDSELKNRLR